MSASASTGCIWLGFLAACLVAGCAINPEPDFDSPVPQDRFLAIRQAGESKDRAAIPDLIRQLGSDDPLVRQAAIEALEGITGRILDFDPHAAPIERNRAIDRWMEWTDGQQAPADGPGETRS